MQGPSQATQGRSQLTREAAQAMRERTLGVARRRLAVFLVARWPWHTAANPLERLCGRTQCRERTPRQHFDVTGRHHERDIDERSLSLRRSSD